MIRISLVVVMCSISLYGVSQEKDYVNLTGEWQCIKGQDTTNLVFINSVALKFNFGPENPFNKVIFLYKIDTINSQLVLTYHVEEVATTNKMLLWIISPNKIKLQGIDEKDNKKPLNELPIESEENTGIFIRFKDK